MSAPPRRSWSKSPLFAKRSLQETFTCGLFCKTPIESVLRNQSGHCVVRERLTSKFPSRLRSRFHPANALMPRAEAAFRILNRAPSTSNQTPRIQVRQGPINCLFEHVGSISPREIFSRICGAPLNCLIVAFFDAESPLDPKAMSSSKHHNTATPYRSAVTPDQATPFTASSAR